MTNLNMSGDAKNVHYRGVATTKILRLGAINPDLTSDMSDPRNAVYRVPLSGADLTGFSGLTNEEMAHGIASAGFCAVSDQRSDDPDFDADIAYEQCLVDARRIMLDPSYERLFD